jgi:hypothetical protein
MLSFYKLARRGGNNTTGCCFIRGKIFARERMARARMQTGTDGANLSLNPIHPANRRLALPAEGDFHWLLKKPKSTYLN